MDSPPGPELIAYSAVRCAGAAGRPGNDRTHRLWWMITRSRFVNFLNWTVSSWFRHVVGFGTLFAVPMCALFLYMNYDQGTLDFLWGLWIVFGCAVLGVAWATLMWFTVIRPLGRRRNLRK